MPLALAPLLAKLLIWFGPIVANARMRTAGRLPALPSAATVTLIGMFAVIAAGAWWLRDRISARHDTSIRTETITATTTALEKAALVAEVRALRGANAERERANLLRAQSLAAQSTALANFETAQEHARDASPNPDTILIPAGDPWLVRYRPFGVQQGAAAADPVRRADRR